MRKFNALHNIFRGIVADGAHLYSITDAQCCLSSVGKPMTLNNSDDSQANCLQTALQNVQKNVQKNVCGFQVIRVQNFDEFERPTNLKLHHFQHPEAHTGRCIDSLVPQNSPVQFCLPRYTFFGRFREGWHAGGAEYFHGPFSEEKKQPCFGRIASGLGQPGCCLCLGGFIPRFQPTFLIVLFYRCSSPSPQPHPATVPPCRFIF